MKATLIDVMGDDLKVVNAARVSFAKQSEYEIVDVPTTFGGRIGIEHRLPEADQKLIKYLAKHNHWTPFGHAQLTFHVKAPIFVARQLVKHQVGLVWNEVSRRYVDDKPEFWWPTEWRLRAANVKQGSSDKSVAPQDIVLPSGYKLDAVLSSFEDVATNLYQEMLECGFAPEMARIVLPVNLQTEWHWTGSLAAFSRVCKLRLDPHAQKEVQYIAQDIDREIRECEKFKHSWPALMGTSE